MKKLTILTIIFLIIFFAAIALATIFYSQPHNTTPDSLSSTIAARVILDNQEFNLEIAQTFKEKQQGLMYRNSLPRNQGMLFLYNYESPKSFWMKNTLIPLDLIFLNSSNYIVDIKENFQPCTKNPCETYSSEPAQNIIEINAGLSNELGLEIGDVISLNYNNS